MADGSEIAFFDLETTRTEQGVYIIVEFGVILVDSRTLQEVEGRSYSTLVRPANPTHINSFVDRSNGITKEALASAPTFAQIADDIYDRLHGTIWAGHNIEKWDCEFIRKAFKEIGRIPPEPKGPFDSLKLLVSQRFGDRAGDKKLASVASFFGLDRQNHRSLDDLRMNIKVLKCCSTVLLMESIRPDLFLTMDFFKPDDISTPSIYVTLEPNRFGPQKIQIRHKNVPLKLSSGHLIRSPIDTKSVNDSGQQRLHFLVDAPPSLCKILYKCNRLAQEQFLHSGSSSKWHRVVRRRGFNVPTLRLYLPTEDGDVTRLDTKIYKKDASGFSSRFVVTDDHELESLFIPGNHVDAYFSVDAYDYKRQAGIRLVAKMLILHSAYT